ncbi:cyclase family protein [Myxococcota bacterium]|nr:cyclase family protein [Myxococcota bacterium]
MAEEVTSEYVGRVFEQVKNWGKWGADDQRGALNYITDEIRASAASLIQDGACVSCALDFPVEPSPNNPHPAQHMMVVAGDACCDPRAPGLEMTMDFIGIAFHGMASSHIDALCHVLVDGKMYNGFPAGEVLSTGARKGSVMAASDGITSRGVLLDIPRLRGKPWCDVTDRIQPEDLEAAEREQGLEVREGDILLIGTGRHARQDELGPWQPMGEGGGLAGLDPRCIPFLHERRIAVLGSDGIQDAMPGYGLEDWAVPIHQCCLVAMGVHLLDNLDLRALSAACAERNRWEFFLSVSPLRVAGGTGSPINPIATF